MPPLLPLPVRGARRRPLPPRLPLELAAAAAAAAIWSSWHFAPGSPPISAAGTTGGCGASMAGLGEAVAQAGQAARGAGRGGDGHGRA